MHQTKKGNQWYFGMKAHMGMDSKEGLVHSVCSTAASVSDVHMLLDLLYGGKKKVWGDGGYQGQTEAIYQAAPEAQDMTLRRVRNQSRYGRSREAQEPDQGPRARQGGMVLSHPQARVQLHQSVLSRHEEEPRVDLRGV
jgi:Transposase DDE domain